VGGDCCKVFGWVLIYMRFQYSCGGFIWSLCRFVCGLYICRPEIRYIDCWRKRNTPKSLDKKFQASSSFNNLFFPSILTVSVHLPFFLTFYRSADS